jgi:hypothetical protein
LSQTIKRSRPPLHPELKIRRALTHIHELEKCLNDYKENYRPQVSLSDDGKINLLVPEVHFPENPSLIVGDAIHNLRSALDIMTTMGMDYFGQDRRKYYFPIDATRSSFLGQRGFKEIKSISPEFATLISDQIKPYKEENYGFWALNQMDNSDKHRLLVVSIHEFQFNIKIIRDDDDSSELLEGTICLLEKGKLPKQGSLADIHNKKALEGFVDLKFGPNEPYPSQSIIPILYDLKNLVEGTMHEFIKFFASHMKREKNISP